MARFHQLIEIVEKISHQQLNVGLAPQTVIPIGVQIQRLFLLVNIQSKAEVGGE